MQEYVADNFIIYYEPTETALVNIVAEQIENNLTRLLRFFNIEHLSNKKKVYIYNNLGRYKEHISQFDVEYSEYMLADAGDDNINLLTLELCRKVPMFHNMTEEEYTTMIVHELVHACQYEVNPLLESCLWFWEALATNLSGQTFPEIPIDCTKEQLLYEFLMLQNNHPIAYTIGKYMLSHYSHEQILEYVENPKELEKEFDNIWCGVKKSEQ